MKISILLLSFSFGPLPFNFLIVANFKYSSFEHRINDFILYIAAGLIIGAIIRYGFKTNSEILHMSVEPSPYSKYNESVPPDTLWLHFPEDKGGGVKKNKTFAYNFRGEIFKQDNEIDLKVIQSTYKFCIFKRYMGQQSLSLK